MTASPRRIGAVLLEDNDLDAELVVAQLEAELAIDVRRCRSVEEYLPALAQEPIDIVLSDFALPGYDGVAALEAARQRIPDVPFIFVSGAIGEERAIETLQRGATDYVLKHRLGRLVTAVTRALGLAEERRRRREAESERDRLLESERLARETAEAANRMKDEFLAIASHELRTPLNAMLGWASLLTTTAPDAALLAKGLEIIRRNAVAQSRLIEDILDISRIVTGKLQLRTARLPVMSFVQPAVESVRPAAAAKHISISLEVDGNEIIHGDSGRLQQVLWNLLSNAVKFTPAHGAVRVSTTRDEETISIAVEDSGQGIDGDFLPYVFERFRQADPTATRRAGGLGLGLSIVRYLVEAHGGSISAESAGNGRGSRFVVRLPRELVSDKPATNAIVLPAPDEDLQEDTPPASLRGIRVLLVEDDLDSRELIAFILRAHGAQVSVAASANDALQIFKDEIPTIVISDIGMPDMDGYSLMRRLRELPRSAGGATPAIALTAYTRELDRHQAEAAGFQRHLAKPVTPDVLLRAVNDALAGGLSCSVGERLPG